MYKAMCLVFLVYVIVKSSNLWVWSWLANVITVLDELVDMYRYLNVICVVISFLRV